MVSTAYYERQEVPLTSNYKEGSRQWLLSPCLGFRESMCRETKDELPLPALVGNLQQKVPKLQRRVAKPLLPPPPPSLSIELIALRWVLYDPCTKIIHLGSGTPLSGPVYATKGHEPLHLSDALEWPSWQVASFDGLSPQ